MENNNGRGIFYGVIGVATLVVAIIGATFAYFSASAASNNAINVGSTTLTLALTGETRNFYSDLIPVATTGANLANFKAYPGLVNKVTTGDNQIKGRGSNSCSDEVGNSICSVYQFTIGNPSTNTSSQRVYGRLEVTENKFPLMTADDVTGGSVVAEGKTNLHYAVFKGAASTLYGNFDLSGTVGNVTDNGTKLIQGKTALGAKGSVETWTDNTSQLLAPGASQTYTIVVWLEENGAFNAGDQGKLFTAAVKFDTGSGQGVTGQLVAGA